MQEKVLLVEDSLFICKAVQKSLQCQIDFEIDIAHSLEETITLAEKNHYFISLLDLNLPDAPDGEILDYMTIKQVPFIVFTGNDSAKVKTFCEKHTLMIDYVNKESVYSINYLATLINRLQKNRAIEALIIDDSTTGRKRVAEKLGKAMLKIHEASAGEPALRLLDQHNKIRLVMIDYNLPGMNGFELCKTIRERPDAGETVIIGFSGGSDHSLAAGFLKSGANDYIPKTCSQEELLCRVIQNLNMQDYIQTYRIASNQDFLTGLYNRRFLFDSFPMIEAGSRRHHHSIAVAVLDVDHFKQINDAHGHKAGDAVLKSLADNLKHSLRESDLLARIGGEEFCMVAENCNHRQAEALFEKVRRNIEQQRIPIHDEESINITVSIGIHCANEPSVEAMMKLADDNLYQAKAGGRNRIIISSNNA